MFLVKKNVFCVLLLFVILPFDSKKDRLLYYLCRTGPPMPPRAVRRQTTFRTLPSKSMSHKQMWSAWEGGQRGVCCVRSEIVTSAGDFGVKSQQERAVCPLLAIYMSPGCYYLPKLHIIGQTDIRHECITEMEKVKKYEAFPYPQPNPSHLHPGKVVYF